MARRFHLTGVTVFNHSLTWLSVFFCLACGATPESSTQKVPLGFERTLEWSHLDRELRLARTQGVRLFNQAFPKYKIHQEESWLITPQKVFRRPSQEGYDWFFRFESTGGRFIELTVLSSGGIEDFDMGLTSSN